MPKNKSINTLVLFVALVLVVSGCMGGPPPQQQQVTQQVQEGPAPDYTNINTALADPSKKVRKQAVKTLSEVKHSSAIPKLIQAVKDNKREKEIVDEAANGLINHKERAISLVKENLWTEQDGMCIYAAHRVLSRVMKPADYIPEAVAKFYEVPYDPDAKEGRQEIVKFIIKNGEKENIDITGDLVTMLQDEDDNISFNASRKLSDLKDPKILQSLIDLYYIKRDNPQVVLSILKVLNSYPAPDPRKPDQKTINDITVFLETFGSYDKRTQEATYEGLKTFGYNDPEGRVVKYIQKFEECDSDLVRSHVVDLVQVLSTKEWPQNIPAPVFDIPSNTYREGYCQ